jgi:hypothetical protein
MSEWQPIVTLKDGDPWKVLLWDSVCGCVVGIWIDADDDDPDGYPAGWEIRDILGDFIEGCEPMHWMKIPGKPEGSPGQ